MDVQANQRPSRVLLERLPDGSANIRLADDIREETEDGQTMYRYNEVTFYLPFDRSETQTDIERDFGAWWRYGSAPEEPAPTLEERVDELEALMIAMLGGE